MEKTKKGLFFIDQKPPFSLAMGIYIYGPPHMYAAIHFNDIFSSLKNIYNTHTFIIAYRVCVEKLKSKKRRDLII